MGQVMVVSVGIGRWGVLVNRLCGVFWVGVGAVGDGLNKVLG